MKKREKEVITDSLKTKHPIILSFVIIITIIIILIIYFYLISGFKPGDLVYKKDNAQEIGIVRAFNIFRMNYAVSWPDGSVSEENMGSIEKIAKLNQMSINKSTNGFNVVNNKTKQKPSSMKNDFYDTRKIETNFSDYFIQTEYSNLIEAEKVTGIFYKGFSLGIERSKKKDCKFEFTCGEWSECSLDYNLLNLVERNLSRGIQYIYCEDKNNCLPSIIDSRSCYLKENITIRKNILCGVEQIEFVSTTGEVVGRINTNNRENYAEVNINLIDTTGC